MSKLTKDNLHPLHVAQFCNDAAYGALNYLTALNNHFTLVFSRNSDTLISDFAFVKYFAIIATALSNALNDK